MDIERPDGLYERIFCFSALALGWESFSTLSLFFWECYAIFKLKALYFKSLSLVEVNERIQDQLGWDEIQTDRMFLQCFVKKFIFKQSALVYALVSFMQNNNKAEEYRKVYRNFENWQYKKKCTYSNMGM